MKLFHCRMRPCLLGESLTARTQTHVRGTSVSLWTGSPTRKPDIFAKFWRRLLYRCVARLTSKGRREVILFCLHLFFLSALSDWSPELPRQISSTVFGVSGSYILLVVAYRHVAFRSQQGYSAKKKGNIKIYKRERKKEGWKKRRMKCKMRVMTRYGL